MSCCGGGLRNGEHLKNHCYHNKMANPNNEIGKFYEIYFKGRNNRFIYCVKYKNTRYFSPAVHFGSYTFFNPSNIDVDVCGDYVMFENFISSIDFKRSNYKPALIELTTGICNFHKFNCMLDSSNSGTYVFKGSMLHITPIISEGTLINNKSVLKGLSLPLIESQISNNIIWTEINTDMANDPGNTVVKHKYVKKPFKEEHVYARVFNTSPMHNPVIKIDVHQNDVDKIRIDKFVTPSDGKKKAKKETSAKKKPKKSEDLNVRSNSEAIMNRTE